MIPVHYAPSLSFKLAWLALYCEELAALHSSSPAASHAKAMLDDAEVTAWLDSFPQILLSPIRPPPTEVSV